MKHLYFFILLGVIISCVQPKRGVTLQEGKYLLTLKLDSAELPVRLLISTDSAFVEVINGKEVIRSENFLLRKDTIAFRFPVFNSEFIGKVSSDTTFEGSWHNYHKGDNYKIPFKAYKRDWSLPGQTPFNISGKWESIFSEGTPDEYKAIGEFEQKGTKLTGTFLTETGDYRFLEGQVLGDTFFLSCFDGTHAYYFKGNIKNDSVITNAKFHSGKTWSEPWKAKRNEQFRLRNPNELTFLKPGFSSLEFTFPDLDQKMVSLNDEKFRGKAVIVQIMGSWCPNCLDESMFLNELYKKYNHKGLEIISLAYESRPDFGYASKRVKALKQRLEANYTFLIAGTSNKEEAAKTLPMLNHILSFPTAVFLNRKHEVVKIHTGFSGPGTGVHYENFRKETEELIQSLLEK